MDNPTEYADGETPAESNPVPDIIESEVDFESVSSVSSASSRDRVSSPSSESSEFTMPTTSSKKEKKRPAEYEVERISRMMFDTESGEVLYCVKWVGYPESESTWEPRDNLKLADYAIKRFLTSRKGKDDKEKVENARKAFQEKKADAASAQASTSTSPKTPKSTTRKRAASSTPQAKTTKVPKATTKLEILNVSRSEAGVTQYKVKLGGEYDRRTMTFEEVVKIDPLLVARYLDNLI
uniref:Chromo domain-containing protein n=1 Tax=Steinernema glaseri TaxID=37863 RepID=A0A1I8ASL2_9BILA